MRPAPVSSPGLLAGAGSGSVGRLVLLSGAAEPGGYPPLRSAYRPSALQARDLPADGAEVLQGLTRDRAVGCLLNALLAPVPTLLDGRDSASALPFPLPSSGVRSFRELWQLLDDSHTLSIALYVRTGRARAAWVAEAEKA